MINGVYQIVMNTMMGRKCGLLTLYERDHILSGYIDILGCSNEITGEIRIDGSCRFSGKFITPVRDVEFWAEGRADEKTADLLIHTDRDILHVLGEPVPV